MSQVSHPRLLRSSIFSFGIPHPECLAIGPNQALYCGCASPNYNDTGPIYRISPDRKEITEFANTGGRVLGLTFDNQGGLYACDVKQGAIFYINRVGRLERFASEVDGRKIKSPNFIIIAQDGSLLVSDSGTAKANEKTGAIYRLFPNGDGEVLYDSLVFPNGLALSLDGASLFVVLTRDNQVIELPLQPKSDGSSPSIYIDGIDDGPDGICFDRFGNLFIAVTQTNQIVCKPADSSEMITILDDPFQQYLATPSNCVFYGEEGKTLLVPNLFGHHITKLDIQYS